ncbi:hypothetical protein ABPG74_000304 [Tetrahymena malaccensis]
MCIPFESIQPTTQKAQSCVNTLKILALCEVVISLLKMILFKDIVSGIYELLSCLILWMSWAQLSYCFCLFYIVYICVLGSISYAVGLLTPVQNNQPFFGKSNTDHAIVAFSIIFLIFYVVAAYLTFQAYKEFKACQYEQGQFGMMGLQGAGQGQAVGGASYSSSSQRNNQNYGTNYNYGGAGSGDTEAYYPPPSSNTIENNRNQNASTSNQGGSSQYFQGKGVRIG